MNSDTPDFVALDVETANADLSSICQIGIAGFKDRQVVFEWSSFVNPRDEFSPLNIAISGIRPEMVAEAPTLPTLESTIREHLSNRLLVCHTPFDRVSVHQAFARNALSQLEATWLDSARVARRAWPEVSARGYGLANLCHLIGHDFRQHDALEDARAAGKVLVAAMEKTGLSIEDWVHRAQQRINLDSPDPNEPIRRLGDPDGPLFGEVLVFTGSLRMPRREAADMASVMGCEVGATVTKHTTILVVGDQDLFKLAGHEKSIKHRKAEGLIARGQPIRILRESDFSKMVSVPQA